MRRIFYIPALLLIYLLTTAKSCDHQEQFDESVDQFNVKRAQDSIKSIFESDTLSMVSLHAFEATAKIRFADFSDYLVIAEDTSAAETFREKAKKMIRGLFISENSVIRCKNPDNHGSEEIPILQLLKEGKEPRTYFERIIKDSIRIKDPLKMAGDSNYIGKLSFSFVAPRQKTSKNLKQPIGGGTIDFLVTRHEKMFGKDTLIIWDVFLGSIK